MAYTGGSLLVVDSSRNVRRLLAGEGGGTRSTGRTPRRVLRARSPSPPQGGFGGLKDALVAVKQPVEVDGGPAESAQLASRATPDHHQRYGSTAALTRMNFGLTKSEAVLVENALRLIAESDPERAEAAIALRGKLHDTVAKQLAPIPDDFLDALQALATDERFTNRRLVLDREPSGDGFYNRIHVGTGDEAETIRQLEEFATARGFKSGRAQMAGFGHVISLYH